MGFKFVVLWTDVALWLMFVALVGYGFYVRRNPHLRATWRNVARDPAAVSAALVMSLFVLVTMVDSVHFRRALPDAKVGGKVFYDTRTESVLDLLLQRQIQMRETSYSAPLSTHAFSVESTEVNGKTVRDYPRLDHAGRHLKKPLDEATQDVVQRVVAGVIAGIMVFLLASLWAGWLHRKKHVNTGQALRDIFRDRCEYPVRAGLLTVLAVAVLAGPVVMLADYYHVFGTDRTGNDVLVLALKSIRTAFVIGALSTLATLPLALGLGVMAGYLGGWVDEVIQYLYTTLTSVPNVLLIAACVLMVQVFLDKNPGLFETSAERADLKIFLLCLILGVTGWGSLCRLIRGETLKLRELDYVQAAHAFGVGHAKIMARHIAPNVMHLVLITTVLNFSDLILYEAVLTYVGVGVDGSLTSFGGMINLARSEMARDPVVWWSFAAAFVFMVTMVLAANVLADGVRDAFDPRAAKFRVRQLAKA